MPGIKSVFFSKLTVVQIEICNKRKIQSFCCSRKHFMAYSQHSIEIEPVYCIFIFMLLTEFECSEATFSFYFTIAKGNTPS